MLTAEPGEEQAADRPTIPGSGSHRPRGSNSSACVAWVLSQAMQTGQPPPLHLTEAEVGDVTELAGGKTSLYCRHLADTRGPKKPMPVSTEMATRAKTATALSRVGSSLAQRSCSFR